MASRREHQHRMDPNESYAESLPEETEPRIRMLVEDSAPDPNRPQLRPDTEANLNEIDRKSAACYAELEEITFQFHQIAKNLKKNSKG